MKKNTILTICVTGVMIALLVTLQWGLGALTASNQFVVGSAVNLVLIVAAVIGGLYSGICVAVISPFVAYFFGIGPQLIPMIPFIALGNLALVLVWSLICKGKEKQYIRLAVSAFSGAIVKFGVLYASIVLIAVPYILDINEKQAEKFTAMFSWPQLVTALIGGVLAFAVLPPLKKAFKK